MTRIFVAALLTISPVAPALAQSETPSWDPVAAGQLGALVDGTRQRTPATAARATTDSATRARATCTSKAKAKARLGADDPQVRRLYALCAQAGY